MFAFHDNIIILEDDLYGLIYIAQWVYKNKLLHLTCYCFPFVCIGFFCVFLRYAITQWKNVISLDILTAVIFIEVGKINHVVKH